MEIGTIGYAETTVNQSNIASCCDPALPDVFSTPSLVSLMEVSCASSVKPFLEDGQGTVGIRIELDHLAPTPLGQKVWAESELIDISGKILTFKVTAFSNIEKIGEAIHKRCIINTTRFLDRMNSRYC